jgi:hypothetical protein
VLPNLEGGIPVRPGVGGGYVVTLLFANIKFCTCTRLHFTQIV